VCSSDLLTEDITIVMLCNKYNRGIYNVQPILKIMGAHHFEEEVEEPSPENGDASAGSNNPK